MHLAELNVGKLIADPDDPKVADFMNALDKVNAIAERSEGFIWRLKDEAGNATAIPFGADPRVIPNLSVWRDADALKNFVFNTIHKGFFARRQSWFEKMDQAHFVMWEVPEGHLPTIEEAHDRLTMLRAKGDTAEAFGWQWLIRR